MWWASGKVQVEGAHFSNRKLEPCFILFLGMSACALYVTGKNSFERELVIAKNNRQPGKLAWSNSMQLRLASELRNQKKGGALAANVSKQYPFLHVISSLSKRKRLDMNWNIVNTQ